MVCFIVYRFHGSQFAFKVTAMQTQHHSLFQIKSYKIQRISFWRAGFKTNCFN